MLTGHKNTIMTTDGLASTWRLAFCVHNDVLHFPYIYTGPA